MVSSSTFEPAFQSDQVKKKEVSGWRSKLDLLCDQETVDYPTEIITQEAFFTDSNLHKLEFSDI